jgi:hypothetical protein
VTALFYNLGLMCDILHVVISRGFLDWGLKRAFDKIILQLVWHLQ